MECILYQKTVQPCLSCSAVCDLIHGVISLDGLVEFCSVSVMVQVLVESFGCIDEAHCHFFHRFEFVHMSGMLWQKKCEQQRTDAPLWFCDGLSVSFIFLCGRPP